LKRTIGPHEQSPLPNGCSSPWNPAAGPPRAAHRPTDERWSFDKTGEERADEFAQVSAMNQQLPRLASFSIPQENGRIYFAIIVSGAAILLMILAEMKFFGT
jgi:hypothetical protein